MNATSEQEIRAIYREISPLLAGKFIVLEGADATGKTTQAKILTSALQFDGADAVYMAFPRRQMLPLGAIVNDSLRGNARWMRGPDHRAAEIDDAYIRQSLMVIDKLLAVKADISPALERRMTVVSDRWTDSATVYGLLDGLSSEWLADVNALLPKPDVTLLFHAASGKAYRSDPDEIYESAGKRARLLRSYLSLFTRSPDTSRVTIDAEGSIEDVAWRVAKTLRRVFQG